MENKVALVTGAGSGIGRAVAIELAAAGAKVLVTDLSGSTAQETRLAITARGGVAVAMTLDVRRPEQHAAAVRHAEETFGGLHIACNNAGVARGPGIPRTLMADADSADWLAVLDVNLNGVFHGMQAQIPAILACGGGSIVNVASVLGQVGTEGASPYVTSKHAVVGLTRAAALDYAAQGLRINCVGPGYVETDLLLDRSPVAAAGRAALHPMGRSGTPEEIAALICWLAGDAASFATAGYYPVDGGYLAR